MNQCVWQGAESVRPRRIPGGTRTPGPPLWRRPLYQLSYRPNNVKCSAVCVVFARGGHMAVPAINPGLALLAAPKRRSGKRAPTAGADWYRQVGLCPAIASFAPYLCALTLTRVKGVRRRFVPPTDNSWRDGSFAPSGAPCRTHLVPWLTPWAIFWRPCGAGTNERYTREIWKLQGRAEGRGWPG
jgi:hypothetical protein